MKISFIKRFLAAGAIIPVLLFSSCIKDRVEGGEPSGDDAMVTFSFSVPGPSTPATRAMSEADENAIAEVSVLAFKSGVFSYKASCSLIEANGATNKKKFTVILRKGQYDLVVVANAASILSGVNLAAKSKADAMALLEAGMPSGNKWAVSGSIISIPMWGNVGSKEVGTDAIPEISLLRMVARVNVALTEASSKFEMTSVHLYNYNSKGMLAPTQAEWNTTPVTAPNLPSAPGHVEGPIAFGVTATNISANDIYMFEVAAGSKTSLSTNPCIVVGGTYESQPAFYRIDFCTSPDAYLAIKRNHSYNIRITAVNNAGHPTADDAFRAGPDNIAVDILEWNEGGKGEMKFDGQNYLFVKPETVFNFTKEADAQTVKLKTDVPAGWKIVKITEADGTTINSGWLTTDKTVNTSYGAGEVETPASINVSANATGVARTGYIFIKAGRLDAKLTVNQSIKAKRVPVFTFIEYENVNGTGLDVPTTGGQIKAKVYTNMGWTLKSSINGVESVMAEPASETAANYDLSINIPALTDLWASATTKVWIEYTGFSLQETTYTQTGYNISISGAPATVSKSGENVILNLAGYFPTMNFRAVNAADVSKVVSNVAACTATGAASSNGTSTVTINVYPNGSGTARNVKFQYEKSAGVWIDIATASQAWSGVVLPTTGIIAPPGIIGVGATTGKLTLDGSKEYPDGKADETVYVVHFKWGSTVAISAGTLDYAYKKTNVAWLPEGFTGTITDHWSSIESVTGATLPPQNNAAGFGDPCKLAVHNGTMGGYKMPTESPWFESFGTWKTYTGVMGRWNAASTQFYPVTGCRDNSGNLLLYDVSGIYWINAVYSNNPYSLSIDRNGVASEGYGNPDRACAIRCIRE